MLGCVVGQLGDAPELASCPQPDRLPGQSLVKVTAAALNAIDLLISSGKHPAGAPPVPHVPGAEAYRDVALLAASGRFDLPVRAFPAAQVGEAWAAQAQSPGAKVVVAF